ncbi:hypothetical protein Emag_004393 [Eimeria magna]
MSRRSESSSNSGISSSKSSRARCLCCCTRLELRKNLEIPPCIFPLTSQRLCWITQEDHKRKQQMKPVDLDAWEACFQFCDATAAAAVATTTAAATAAATAAVAAF